MGVRYWIEINILDVNYHSTSYQATTTPIYLLLLKDVPCLQLFPPEENYADLSRISESVTDLFPPSVPAGQRTGTPCQVLRARTSCRCPHRSTPFCHPFNIKR
jgi:hypothetical protein